MEARFITQVIRPDGHISHEAPSPDHLHYNWYKEYRLEVGIGGQRYAAKYRTPYSDPLTNCPDFESYVKKDLARRVGKLLTDNILDKL